MAETPAGAVKGEQLADLFGIDLVNMRDLASRGVVKRVGRNLYAFRESVQGYTKHLRDMAARWKSSDGIDAARESALLNQERRMGQRMENMQKAGQLIPVEMVESIMQDHIKGLRAIILGWTNEAASEMPHLTAHDLQTLKRIAEGLLRDNATRALALDGMHPEVKEYIDEKRGISSQI